MVSARRNSGSPWLKVSVTTPDTVCEAVGDLMAVLSGSGVEQRPLGGGLSTISGFFRLDRDREALLEEVALELAGLFSLYNLPAPDLCSEFFKDEDWATAWQQYFHTFEIVPGLHIKPSWEDFVPPAGEEVIELDPGQAFGTGQHASTGLALALVREALGQGPLDPVLDVGTGTGILAMAAARFGATGITAIDNDPGAVEVARQNIAANRLEHLIRAAATPLEDIQGTCALLLANIVHNVLLEMLPQFVRLSESGTRLVLAGMLHGEQERSLAAAYGNAGFDCLRSLHREEWAALLLARR